jgi:hypothetical protein
MSDLIEAVQDACDDKTWRADETRTLAIEFDGGGLSPRKCELRLQAPFGVFAVKFLAKIDEVAAVASEEALTWLFTLRQGKTLIGKKNGWRIAGLTSLDDSKYEVCLQPY